MSDLIDRISDWDMELALEVKAEIEQLQKELDNELAHSDRLQARNEKLEAALRMSEWISVEERLPEAKTYCLVIDCDRRKVAEFNYTISNHPKPIWYGATDSVTHWIPLPEPPK